MFDGKNQGPRSQVFNDDGRGTGIRVSDFKEFANVEELVISCYEVSDDKHCKDEGLFYAKEHDLEVGNLHDEDSGNDEVLVDEGLELKTTSECGLRESNSLDEESKGEETV